MPLPFYRHRSRTTGATATRTIVEWDGSAGDENWATGANWDTGSAPTANDSVYIGTGSSDITQSLGQSAINLISLHMGPEWSGSMQTLQINAGLVTINKRFGQVALDGIYDKIQVLNTGADAEAISLDGTLRLVIVNGTRGEVKIADSSTLLNMQVIPHPGRAARVTIGSGVSSIGTVKCAGPSSLTTSSDITTLELDGQAEATASGTASIGTLKMGGASVYNHESSGSISTSAEMWQGSRLRCHDNANSSFTITSLTGKGGKADFRTGLNSLSAGGTWTYYAGTWVFDPGTTLTVS